MSDINSYRFAISYAIREPVKRIYSEKEMNKTKINSNRKLICCVERNYSAG